MKRVPIRPGRPHFVPAAAAQGRGSADELTNRGRVSFPHREEPIHALSEL
jgi:hypothetical protein